MNDKVSIKLDRKQNVIRKAGISFRLLHFNFKRQMKARLINKFPANENVNSESISELTESPRSQTMAEENTSSFNNRNFPSNTDQSSAQSNINSRNIGNKYFSIKNREEHRTDRFKLYYENELPSFDPKIFHVELENPVCDNDCQTENEEIEISKKYIENELTESLLKYIRNPNKIENISKYHKKNNKTTKDTIKIQEPSQILSC